MPPKIAAEGRGCCRPGPSSRPCERPRTDPLAEPLVYASHHAPPFRSDGCSRPLSGRDILIAAKEIGRVEFRFERYQSVVVYPVCLTHAMAFARSCGCRAANQTARRSLSVTHGRRRCYRSSHLLRRANWLRSRGTTKSVNARTFGTESRPCGESTCTGIGGSSQVTSTTSSSFRWTSSAT